MKQVLIEKNSMIQDQSGESFNITAGAGHFGNVGIEPGGTVTWTFIFSLKIVGGGYGLRFDAPASLAQKGVLLLGGDYNGQTLTLYLKNTNQEPVFLADYDVLAVGSFYEKISFRQIDEVVKNGVIDLNVSKIEVPTKRKARRKGPQKKEAQPSK